MIIFNKQIVQEGFRSVSNIHNGFFPSVCPLMPHPIPVGWAGDEPWGAGNTEVTFFFLYQQWQTPQTSKKSEESPSLCLSRSHLATQTSMLGVIPKIGLGFFGMSSNSCTKADLKFGREKAFRAEKSLFWSHKMFLSFNWVINWFLRSPFFFFFFFSPWSFPPLAPRPQVGFMKFQRILTLTLGPNITLIPSIFSHHSLTPLGASTEGIFLCFPRKRRWARVEDREKQRTQYYIKQLCVKMICFINIPLEMKQTRKLHKNMLKGSYLVWIGRIWTFRNARFTVTYVCNLISAPRSSCITIQSLTT